MPSLIRTLKNITGATESDAWKIFSGVERKLGLKKSLKTNNCKLISSPQGPEPKGLWPAPAASKGPEPERLRPARVALKAPPQGPEPERLHLDKYKKEVLRIFLKVTLRDI